MSPLSPRLKPGVELGQYTHRTHAEDSAGQLTPTAQTELYTEREVGLFHSEVTKTTVLLVYGAMTISTKSHGDTANEQYGILPRERALACVYPLSSTGHSLSPHQCSWISKIPCHVYGS